MRNFGRSEDGYALVLTLMFMPVFIGLSLMIIDLGRGNNAHSDLYAAADALALAGAAELDGGSDAIPRAKNAMENLTNTVSFLGLGDGEEFVSLVYDQDDASNEFNVIFLTSIPANDETPIDQAWIDANGTNSSLAARFVYVAARSSDLEPIFPVPVSFTRENVPIQATAVAGRNAAACKITPVFICNPFEGDVTTNLQTGFEDGKLHGRLIQLHPSSNADRAGPGNFGFLDIGAGANTLKNYMSGFGADVCLDADGNVDTEPGAKSSIRKAMNVRFDIFDSNYKPTDYITGVNVRKGYSWTGDACNGALVSGYDFHTADTDGSIYAGSGYTGFPNNLVMAPPGTPYSAPGAAFGVGDWPIDAYMTKNHGMTLAAWNAANPTNEIVSRFPAAQSPGSALPSRYEVYRYEIANNIIAGSGTGAEDGNPLCNAGTANAPAPVDNPDRRLIQAAVVDCEAAGIQGKTADIPIVAYASIFLVRPWEEGSGQTIDVEIVDITGQGGLGTLETFIRVESVLVR
jgi:hypothetical protein